MREGYVRKTTEKIELKIKVTNRIKMEDKFQYTIESNSQEDIYEKYLDSIRVKQNEYEDFKSRNNLNL